MTFTRRSLNARVVTISSALLLMLVSALALPTLVRASNMTVRVATATGAPGKTVEVAIDAAGAPDVGALQLRLSYDAAVLTAEAVSPGSLAGGALLESNLDEPGKVAIALATTDGVRGDGTLLKVRFKVVGKSGAKSDVKLEEVKAWERGGEHFDVLVEVAHGQVSVKEAGGTNWLLFILLGLLALVIVGGVAWWMSRKKRPAPAAYSAAGAAGAQFCSGCGAQLVPGARFCGVCGRPS